MYPDEYDADDYDEIYSANYGGAYYVEVNSTRRGTAPYEKKFSDFNSAFSFAKKRGNSKTIIYIWDIPKEERSSNSVPNAAYDFDSGWQIIRPVGVNEDRSVNKTITSSTKTSNSEDTRTSSGSGIVKEIRDVCYNKLIKIMTSSSFGFDEDEAKDYAFVDAAYDADNYVRVEVRAEVSYNSLMKIAAELDSIIQQYDSEAYFDPEEPGILVALVDLKSAKHKKVNSAYMPEPPIDPPEDDSWTEVDGWIEDVDLDVDAIIEVLDDGSWIYEDETYPWAVSKDSHDGDHYSYEYYVHIGDPGTIVEDFDDVIEKYIPSEEGRYHLKCNATLKYVIEGVEVKQSYYYDERHGEDYDEEVYKDDASVEFDEYNSKVENVSVERIW